ncbi:MAG: hypothetical protein HOJ06_02770, partial [Rhodospirillaceae bacterium]|nr:hypothetical protein [Rhodospirillaceae bacterium]
MQHPTINPLGDTFGAEVVGLDLSQPIEPAVVEELNQALLDNIVLVIRDQDLTAQEFRNGMANFGEPMLQHREAFRLPECPDVSRIINREKMRPAAMWHTDHTNHERPPKATILYARKLPAEGGDTCFANMYAGLDNLSEDSRAQIEDLVTLNSMEPNNPTYSAGDRDEFAQAVRHPMRQLLGRWVAAGVPLTPDLQERLGATDETLAAWALQATRGLNAPSSHAAGRLFDAFAAAIGLS